MPLIIIDESVDLNDELTKSFPLNKTVETSNFQGINRGKFSHRTWESTLIAVDEQGNAFFPDGDPQIGSKDFSYTVQKYQPDQLEAIQHAFSFTLRSMEKIFKQDMKCSSHNVIIGVQVVEPNETQNWSGPWHQDGYQCAYPLTSIVYFNHVNIRSNIAFRETQEYGKPFEHDKILYSMDTYSGAVVTFNNQKLDHRVNNVSRSDEHSSSHRFLLTFVYTGPFNSPVTRMSLDDNTEILHLKQEQQKKLIQKIGANEPAEKDLDDEEIELSLSIDIPILKDITRQNDEELSASGQEYQLYSSYNTTGRPLFFGQKSKTTSEHRHSSEIFNHLDLLK